MSLQVPSLKTIVDLVPSGIVEEVDDLDVSGDVEFNVNVAGVYGDGVFPTIKSNLKIIGGEAKYAKMEYSLDKLNIDANAVVDLGKTHTSYLEINKLEINAASTKINFSGRLNNLLNNPILKANLSADVNFTEL